MAALIVSTFGLPVHVCRHAGRVGFTSCSASSSCGVAALPRRHAEVAGSACCRHGKDVVVDVATGSVSGQGVRTCCVVVFAVEHAVGAGRGEEVRVVQSGPIHVIESESYFPLANISFGPLVPTGPARSSPIPPSRAYLLHCVLLT